MLARYLVEYRYLAFSGNGKIGRHLHDCVGRPILECVPLVVTGRRRHRLAVAARSAGLNPRNNRGDLRIGEARIVGQFAAEFRIGEPRRHLAAHHARLDGPRPRACVFVCDQRHRRRFAGAMTTDASGVEDRRDVVIERDRRCCGGGRDRHHQRGAEDCRNGAKHVSVQEVENPLKP